MNLKLVITFTCLGLISCTRSDNKIEITKGYIPVQDSKIHYKSAGTGKPIIFLHGGFLDSRMWKKQSNEFSKSNNVITLDLPGHGLTIDGDSAFYVAEVVKVLMDSLKLHSASIVGLSLGAMVAMDFIIAYPNYVNKLILATPGILGVNFNVPEDSLLRKYGALMNESLRSKNIHMASEYFVRSWYDGPFRNSNEVDTVMRKEVLQMVEETLQNHKRKYWPRFNEKLAINQLSEVQVPVLLIEGEIDNRVIILNCDTLASTIPTSTKVVIGNAAHMPNLDNAQLFNSILKDFINSEN